MLNVGSMNLLVAPLADLGYPFMISTQYPIYAVAILQKHHAKKLSDLG